MQRTSFLYKFCSTKLRAVAQMKESSYQKTSSHILVREYVRYYSIHCTIALKYTRSVWGSSVSRREGIVRTPLPTTKQVFTLVKESAVEGVKIFYILLLCEPSTASMQRACLNSVEWLATALSYSFRSYVVRQEKICVWASRFFSILKRQCDITPSRVYVVVGHFSSCFFLYLVSLFF